MSEFEIPISMLYPSINLHERKGIIPIVRLPLDYLDFVPDFYKRGGREKIEELTKFIEKSFTERKIFDGELRLKWDDKSGLTHISIGVHGGFDLNEDEFMFQEHNLDGMSSIPAYVISTSYIHELLRSKGKEENV